MSSSNVGEVIYEYYISRGLEFTLSLADKLLQAEESKEKFDRNSRNKVSGDICESVLELCILEYCKLNPEATKNWFYSKSLVIADIDNPDSEFLTEIDFVLFTDSVLVLFECKAYRGDKIIAGNGTIKRESQKDFDVFSQQALHIEAFSKMFSGFKKKDAELRQCYKAAAFIFSPGTMRDTRSNSAQKVMPFLEVGMVSQYLSTITSDKNWQLNYVRKAVELLEKNGDTLRRRHLDYVRGLRSKRAK